MSVSFKQIAVGNLVVFPKMGELKTEGGYAYRSTMQPVKNFTPYDLSDTENMPSNSELRKAYKEYQFTGCEAEFDRWWEFGRKLLIHSREKGEKLLSQESHDWHKYRNAVLDWHYMEKDHREEYTVQ